MQIVIATTPDRPHWLKDCLQSINRDCLVVSDFNFELGKIRFIYENTDIDRFLLLQDSVVIKSPKFFELLDNYNKSVSINDDPCLYGSYMGVYEREVLQKIGIPQIKTKRESIIHEIEWTKGYVAAASQVSLLFNDLRDNMNTGFVERHGRTNMVIENDYLVKYKGTWSWEQLKNC